MRLSLAVSLIKFLTTSTYINSERNTHKNATGPRGWENDQALMSRGKRKDDQYDDEEYHDLDTWEEADVESEGDDDDENDGSDEQRRGRKSGLRSSNQNDINFEKTLEEYDEKEIGYLSEVSNTSRSYIAPWEFLAVFSLNFIFDSI